MHILIIEDQLAILQSLKQGLDEIGYTVEIASVGSVGKKMALENNYNVIILDVMIPEINGIDLCLQIRQQGIKTPVLFISALDSVDDKIAGLEAGGDDYLAKPFSFNEFLARIKALNRRNNLVSESQKIITIGNFEINFDTVSAFRDGKNLDLTKKEFRLLEYFVLNQGKVLSKSEIAEKVWDVDFDTGTNVVEVYVNYLRNKIDKGFEEKMIQTKFGLGYVFNPK